MTDENIDEPKKKYITSKCKIRPVDYPILVTPVMCDSEPRKIAPNVKMALYTNGKLKKCLMEKHTQYKSRLAAIMAMLTERDLPELVDIFYANGTVNQCLKQMQLIAERGLAINLPLSITRDVKLVYKTAERICLRFNTFLEKKYGKDNVLIDVDELLFLTHEGAEEFFRRNTTMLRDKRLGDTIDELDTSDLDVVGASGYDTVEVDVVED